MKSLTAIFYLPAPIFAWMDRAMSAALPAWSRIAVWGALAGMLSMTIYWMLSPREEIVRVRTELRAVQTAMLAYDGDFAGLISGVRHMIHLAFLQAALSVGPALAAVAPGACVITFLQSFYVLSAPAFAMPSVLHAVLTIFFSYAGLTALCLRKLLGVQ
jgi:hypothetical protein